MKAGKLSCVVSGPESAFEVVKPYLETIAPQGVAYVGEGELARICKIAHNVMLGVVIQNLVEITLLAAEGRRAAPRLSGVHEQFACMGSIFTRYKSHALVNLDWTTTFTPALLRKDLDLGLAAARELDVPMPVDGGDARGAAGAFRRRAHAARSAGLSGEGLCRAARDGGARRRQ